MSAVNYNNLGLPSLYSTGVCDILDNLTVSFNQYAEVIRTSAQNASKAQSSGLSYWMRPSAPLISTHTTHVTHVTRTEKEDPEAEKRKKENDNTAFKVFVFAAAIIGGLTGAYYLGQSNGEKAQAKSTKAYLEGLRQQVQTAAEQERVHDQRGIVLANRGTFHIHMNNLHGAILAGETVISEKANSAKNKMILSVSAIAIAIFAAVGAVVNAPEMIIFSGLAVVVLTGVILYRMASSGVTQHALDKKAERVARAFQHLKDDIVKYTGSGRTDLPMPGYYRGPDQLQVHYNLYPQVIMNGPQSSNFYSSGPGSYGRDDWVFVDGILAGTGQMQMPQPSAPPQPGAPMV